MQSIRLFGILFVFLLTLSCTAKIDEGSTAKEYYAKAYQFIDGGYVREGKDLLDLAIKKDPSFLEAYYNRGVVLYFLKEYEAAIKDFNKVIEMDSQNAMAYASRGSVYEKTNHRDLAIRDFKTAAQYGDKDSRAYLKSMGIDW
ncbi:MAG: lipoprotein NlpI [Syntrophorhabdus sp. PtaU1.Bin153]|nr:MAG: lipoprotein NlpI [Syntrophorhabdus sp. PtaU1.Bin153]